MHAYGFMDAHRKTKLVAEGGQFPNAGHCARAESETPALVNAAHAERGDENAAHKLLGRQTGERGVEGEHDDGIDAGSSEETEALGKRSEQAGRLAGTEKMFGVRIEGDGDGLRVDLARFSSHGGENVAMAEVDAVEVADGGYRGTEGGGNLRERTEDGDEP